MRTCRRCRRSRRSLELLAMTESATPPADFAAVAPAIAADAGGAAAVSDGADRGHERGARQRCARACRRSVAASRRRIFALARDSRCLTASSEMPRRSATCFAELHFAVVEDDHFARLLREVGNDARPSTRRSSSRRSESAGVGRASTAAASDIVVAAFARVIANPEVGLIAGELPQPRAGKSWLDCGACRGSSRRRGRPPARRPRWPARFGRWPVRSRRRRSPTARRCARTRRDRRSWPGGRRFRAGSPRASRSFSSSRVAPKLQLRGKGDRPSRGIAVTVRC